MGVKAMPYRPELNNEDLDYSREIRRRLAAGEDIEPVFSVREGEDP